VLSYLRKTNQLKKNIMKTKLKKIAAKFGHIDASESNFSIGGGIANHAFASRRHEHAKNDESRVTLGEANQIFAKATGLPVEEISEIIKFAVPYMEWHHAGKLPKQYGGGMKKTYFLNSSEMTMIAENFESLKSKLELQKVEAKIKMDSQKNRSEIQHNFLIKYATSVTRVTTRPDFFHETNREMNGKFGWFSSYGKGYKLTEYFTGWAFDSQELVEEFYKI
jgi:hypothetical protein